MARRTSTLPMPVLLILTLGPAAFIGATLWMVSALVPACSVAERQRLPAPDESFDLVVFARDCGDTAPNTQAALVPHGEEVPFDAASFVSLAVEADLSPRWEAYGNIELTLPEGAEVLRQDENVAGVSVIYQ